MFEEQVDGRNLSDVINEKHENVKYLPGIKLPTNVHANPNLVDAVKDADILIFNLPHQFVEHTCNEIQGKIKPNACAISCIKGVKVTKEEIETIPNLITSKLGIYCGALSGANLATEIAKEFFSETTIAYAPEQGVAVTNDVVRSLFARPYFHIQLTDDVDGVCICGALKNIIAIAAGIIDGLKWGDNAKAAIMRIGILEMKRFGLMFFPNCRYSTFTEESCGIADVITSCSGGRNRKCAEQFVVTGKV